MILFSCTAGIVWGKVDIAGKYKRRESTVSGYLVTLTE
jgi:hypothetical protein